MAVVSWLNGLARGVAACFHVGAFQPPPNDFVPDAEVLEDRNSVSAIRNIPGFLTNSLPHEDDAPSLVGNLGFTINFLGNVTNTVFVNNNGNVTTGGALFQFTPQDLSGPLPLGVTSIIAPFFADVDTTNAASQVVTFGTGTVCGHRAFGVDWINVGYFASHVDKLNSFQLILIDRSETGDGNFDIEFNYNQILWETGDASGGVNGLGGVSAAVGFNNGLGSSFQLPGSFVNGALLNGGSNALISNDLLAQTPGRYHFLIRNGQVSNFQDVTTSVRVFNPFRFVYNPQNGTYFCNLSVLNLGGQTSCLDEIPSGGLQGLTVVFTGMAPGTSLANATGTTAAGHQFISMPDVNIPLGQSARIPIVINNPGSVPLGTFNMPAAVEVFTGPFDPTVT